MAENKVIEYCALNVAASPHPDGIYVDLLKIAAFKPVGFFGDLFATVSPPEMIEQGFWRGRLLIWTEINKSEPTINKKRLEEIPFEDLDISLPEEVGFNGRVFQYILREQDHILFVETCNDLNKRISPIRIRKIFALLFSPDIQGLEAPLVEVTVIPDEDALIRILNLAKLKKLHIHIVRPNADDIDPQNVLDSLVQQGAKSQDIILIAAAGPDGLTPNDITRSQAAIAAQNGFVEATGFEEDGDKISLSTKSYPHVIRRVVGDYGSTFDEAIAMARETILKLTGN